MFSIGYFKGQSTEYILQHVSGKVKREGVGLNFFYLKYNTNITVIPTTTKDEQFIFNETTTDYQSVTLQGQLTYRINEPKRMASLMDFTIDPKTRLPISGETENLSQRILNTVQMKTKHHVQNLSLEQTLRQAESLARSVLEKIREEKALEWMGVECVGLYFTQVTPTPEMERALEAEYRESLQRKADEAIYARRAAAVEQERKIKENELRTQINIEEKRRELVQLQGENTQMEAESMAKALGMKLAPYKQMDPRILFAMAANELGQNAEKIKNLTVTPDLLSLLIGDKEK